MYGSPPPLPPGATPGGPYDRGRAPANASPRGSRSQSQSQSRLRVPMPSQWLLLAGGALTVVGTALPWWSLTLPGGGGSATLALAGWTTANGKVVVALAALVFLLALLRLLRVPLPAAVWSHERVVYVALGSEALLLALLALLDGVHVVTSGGYIAASAGVGLYLTLVGAAASIAGGALHGSDASWML